MGFWGTSTANFITSLGTIELDSNCKKGSLIFDTSNASTTEVSESDANELSLGAKIGILVAIVVVGLAIIIVGAICCYKAFKKSNKTIHGGVETEF